MFENTRLFRVCSSIALILALGFSTVRAQDSALEDIKYKEDYDRMQVVMKTKDLPKRCEKIIAMYKDSPDMNAELQKYIDNLFIRDLENLLKAQNYALAGTLSEKALKARPKFGEIYFYQGIGLKNSKKNQEAMIAFARSYLIQPNAYRTKAKQQLDALYRATNNGSMVGQDKFIKEAMKGIK